MKDVIEITKDLIKIESTNPGKGEEHIRLYIQRLLEEAKMDVQLDEVSKGRYNLIATIPGECTEENMPKLILICHMDTVVVGEGWSRDPFAAEEANGRIYGRGACDMKSGLACAISAFLKTAKKVNQKEKKLKYSLRMICTVDEEGFMTGIESVVQHGFVNSQDFVMDLEPTDGEIQMGHKGRLWLEVTVHGVTAHASRPKEGADAVAAGAELISRFRTEFDRLEVHPQMGRSTVTFGQIQGGYQPYVVPDQCKIWMDCRLAPPTDRTKVLELFCEICRNVEEKMPGIDITYTVTGDRPYVEENPESILLQNLKRTVLKVTGDLPKVQTFPGYTDTAVIAGMTNNHECMSYGPGNLKYAHKPDEFVEIKDIVRCEKVLKELMAEML